MIRPLLYLAGPYSSAPTANTRRSIITADAIYAHTGYAPLIPHLGILWDATCPHPPEWWYEYDMHLLRACDAIVRLPGASSGADAEMAEAERLCLEVVPFEELPEEAIAAWESR